MSSFAEPGDRHSLFLKFEEQFQRAVQLWVLRCYCTGVILFCFSLGGLVHEKSDQTTEKYDV